LNPKINKEKSKNVGKKIMSVLGLEEEKISKTDFINERDPLKRLKDLLAKIEVVTKKDEGNMNNKEKGN